jgi:outer membrane receptor protein involved in Fe transport
MRLNSKYQIPKSKILGFGLMSLMCISLVYADAPIYGYFWVRYTYDYVMHPDTATKHPHAFSLERGYIRWRTKADPITFSGTVDINMKRGFTKDSDWQVRLKYAHADWALPYVGKFLPEAKLMMGVQKVYFGLLDLWDYPLIERVLEDYTRKMSSADLGVGFYSLLPQGFGDFSVQYFNGSGYSRPTEIDLNKAKCFNASITLPVIIPKLGIMLKGSYWMEKTTKRFWNAATSETLSVDLDEDRIAGVAQLRYALITLIGEYLISEDGKEPDNKITKGQGYTLFGKVDLGKKFAVAGRYDMWDRNVTDTTAAAQNDQVYTTILGLNYKLSDNLLFQFNYQATKYQDTLKVPVDKFMIQAKCSY